ncbi:MAG: Ku protein [Gemmatimonadota bacterium]|nr:MAG: Ku protein [Gemmatimonadota bacterium]
MAARAIAKATIAFGMVAIPVKVIGATGAAKTVRFKQLCPECATPPKQEYRCAAHGVVERGAMLKGYEIAKGQYLQFTADEVKALNADSTKVISIAQFVPRASIDPVWFDKPYYLSAEAGGSRAYALLAEGLRRTERVGLAQFCLRGKQYLVAVAPTTQGLAMYQLRYDYEVRAQEPEATEVLEDAEVDLALRFIESLSADAFDAGKYTDEVYQRQIAAIEAKAAGQPVTAPAPEVGKADINDLMAALKASLAASEGAA